MFPLSITDDNRNASRYDYNSSDAGSYWNIIFYNSKKGSYHLLSDKKILIRSYDYGYNGQENPRLSFAGTYIFYSVVVLDFDNDKEINTKDPTYLFVSDKEGKNFRQVSPSNYHLNSYQFIKSSNKLVMTVYKDSNNDKEFNMEDEITAFEINLETESNPKEVFS